MLTVLPTSRSLRRTLYPRNALKSFVSLLVLAGALCAVSPVSAAEGPWAEGDYIRARLITPHTATGEGTGVEAAVEIALQPDWHIYWRMPGDGGLPPNLQPGDSKNLKNIEIKWPTPHRFEMEGLYGFGYSEQILLPLQLTPEKAGAPLALAFKADIMVCKDICVPQKLVLSLDIPAGIAKRDSQAPLYEDALKQLPFTENRPDMKIENVVMGPEAIVVRAYLSQGFEGADLFVEGPAFYVMEKPLITPDTKDPRYASLVIKTPPGENIAQAIIGKTLTLTLVNKKGQGLERQFEF